MIRKLLSAFGLQLAFTAACLAAFQDPYWSSRVAALGGAFTAVSDDATGVFYNPAAGAGRITHKMGDFNYAKLFAGLDGVNLSLNQVAYAQPVGSTGLVGFGWGNFSATGLYREDTFLVSAAKSFDDGISVGVTGKYLMRGYSLSGLSSRDPVFAGGDSKGVAAVDLHAFTAPSFMPNVSLGITLRSVNQPNTGFRDSEKLPLEIIGGLAFRRKNLMIPVDIEARNGEIRPHFGAELTLRDDTIALRLGSDLSQAGMGLGYRHALSAKLAVNLDYAFILPLGIEGSAGSHRVTLGLKF